MTKTTAQLEREFDYQVKAQCRAMQAARQETDPTKRARLYGAAGALTAKIQQINKAMRAARG